ncbi:MAG: transglycosylase SLT domain-containing protein [Beijerinckiaceae bacterium]
MPKADGIAAAVQAGAERSGTNFNYLLRTAQRESAMNPTAKAGTSSATGLFQFIEQTWLQMVKADGGKHGLNRYAEAIEQRGSRYAVNDPGLRQEILNLRNDPQVSAVLAGELSRRNGASLAQALGRAPTEGELYVAHVMGARGAAHLIREALTNPSRNAAAMFPDEAAANRGLFHDRTTGSARTVGQLYGVLTAGFGAGAPTQMAQAEAPAAGAWLTAVPQASANTSGRRTMDALFRTEGARGPISQSVQRLWGGRAAEVTARARYFPGAEDKIVVEQVAAAQVAPANAAAPTMPNNPAGQNAADRSGRQKQRALKPLDLQSLMKPVRT